MRSESAMVGSEGRARVSRRLEQAGNSVRQRQGRVSVTFKKREKKRQGLVSVTFRLMRGRVKAG